RSSLRTPKSRGSELRRVAAGQPLLRVGVRMLVFPGRRFRRRSDAQAKGRALERVDQAMPCKPRARVRAVARKPPAHAALAEAVTPRVHVVLHTIAAEARQLAGEHDLQIADGAFLVGVAAGVALERGAPLAR